MTNRLFISLDLAESDINRIINLRDNIYGSPNDLAWEHDSKIHITVKFLGDVGENITDLLLNRLEEIEFKKISASFNKFGFFKRNGMLKVLFANLKENKSILDFKKIIDEECGLLGFQKEKRDFKPHLTLLRLKGSEDLNRLKIFNTYEIQNFDFEINSYSLMKSELYSTGSEYTIVKSFNLI
ncbi:MAG: RNA 2',3'-cyclic phosphodiesterase [Melioribacteraceae bacterium]|nr:RNA 2',3'-cyclic phosphodiesterase [Melioribacteraceae bacterium]